MSMDISSAHKRVLAIVSLTVGFFTAACICFAQDWIGAEHYFWLTIMGCALWLAISILYPLIGVWVISAMDEFRVFAYLDTYKKMDDDGFMAAICGWPFFTVYGLIVYPVFAVINRLF
jgi:hypothetical protein